LGLYFSPYARGNSRGYPDFVALYPAGPISKLVGVSTPGHQHY